MSGAGRFAPSPSGELHIGNIRSGLLSFVRARQTGRRFLWRIEDLDRVRAGAAESQLSVFAGLGVVPDEEPLVQSERLDIYAAALSELEEAGLVFECYCSRRDIQQAPSAPHTPPVAYPGTCRDLDGATRARLRDRLAELGRAPALRLRAQARSRTVDDSLLGPITAGIDDFVLRRGDGVFAYNLTVVVDDGASGVDEVCRGDDLASSAPRQAHLAQLLGLPAPSWMHLPLVLNTAGQRLAKRDGAVTAEQLFGLGWEVGDLISWIGGSLVPGRGEGWRTVGDLVEELDFASIVREPTVFAPPVPR